MTKLGFLYVASGLSWLAFWVVGELIARFIFARSKYYIWRPRFSITNHLLPGVFWGLDSTTTFQTNSEGDRGYESPTGDKVYRILFAGGSAAECYFLDQEACLSVRLQRSLEKPTALQRLGATRIHVSSIAKSGVDSDKLQLILRRILPQRRKIDAVVIMVGASNIVNWLRNGAPAVPSCSTPELSELFEWHPEKRFAWFPLKGSALAHGLRRLAWRMFRRSEQRTGVGASITRLRAMRAQATTLITDVPDSAGMLRNFATTLHRSIDICRQSGARVLLVSQPWLDARVITESERSRLWFGAEGDAFRKPVSTYYSSEVFAQLMVELQNATVRVADDAGVEMVEVYDCLHPVAPCFYDDAHFTQQGAAIVADAIARSLLHTSPQSVTSASASVDIIAGLEDAHSVDDGRVATGQHGLGAVWR